MSMRDFKQGILEQQIFDELKDISIKGINYLRSKYEGNDIDYSRLYRRIVNYQIKEYGCTLNNHVPRKSRFDMLKDYDRARKRRYVRRNRL